MTGLSGAYALTRGNTPIHTPPDGAMDGFHHWDKSLRRYLDRCPGMLGGGWYCIRGKLHYFEMLEIKSRTGETRHQSVNFVATAETQPVGLAPLSKVIWKVDGFLLLRATNAGISACEIWQSGRGRVDLNMPPFLYTWSRWGWSSVIPGSDHENPCRSEIFRYLNCLPSCQSMIDTAPYSTKNNAVSRCGALPSIEDGCFLTKLIQRFYHYFVFTTSFECTLETLEPILTEKTSGKAQCHTLASFILLGRSSSWHWRQCGLLFHEWHAVSCRFHTKSHTNWTKSVSWWTWNRSMLLPWSH